MIAARIARIAAFFGITAEAAAAAAYEAVTYEAHQAQAAIDAIATGSTA